MDDFLQTHPLFEEDATGTLPEADTRIPEELKALLALVNSNSYAKGFFKFIPPEEFRDYCALWDFNPDECFPFIKTAFGHLIFYHQQQYKVINPLFNDIDLLGEDGELDFVMDVLLCDRPALEASFCIDIYEQGIDKLGPPKLDEIYAFIPALGLGGSRDVEHVEKTEMQQQMLILSQI